MLKSVLSDLRFAVRTLFKARAFTLVTLATLALGIGANTAMFAAVRSVFLRPLPYPDGERIVRLWETDVPGSRGSVSEQNFVDWKAQTRTVDDMIAFRADSFNLATGSPERLEGQHVTSGMLRLLGVRPLLGRDFLPEEFRPGANRAVMIAHAVWQRHFQQDPGIIGRNIQLSGKSYRVVAVLPADFRFPGMLTELWVPFPLVQQYGRDDHYLGVMGRLRPGATLDSARADLQVISRRLEKAHPDTNQGRSALIKPIRQELVGRLRPMATLLSVAVALVLLIGCANVANLMLARAASRRGEMAVRLALGASRRRLVRQLLTESLLLALAGTALGIAVAAFGTELLSALLSVENRALFDIRLDPQVLGFSVAVAALSAMIFGLAPALQSARADLSGVLREAAARTTIVRGRFQRALVVTEVALSVVLLVGAAVLGRSFARLNDVSVGFDPQRLLTMQIALPEARYPDDAARAAFHDRLLAAVGALPGVESAGVVNFLPMAEDNWNSTIEIVGRPEGSLGRNTWTEIMITSPGYLPTLGVPLLEGRWLRAGDNADAPKVILVNQTFVRRFLRGGTALGQRARINDVDYQIVGVVADVRRFGKTRPPAPEAHFTTWQLGTDTMTLVVRTRGEPTALVAAVRAQVRTLDRGQAVFAVRTMDEIVSESIALRRFQTLLLLMFATMALLLAGLGIYGVMAYHVSQRTQEMGIRMALGAGAGQIQAMVVREGMLLGGLGLAIGAAGALAASRLLDKLVFGVTALDGPSYLVAAVILGTVALLACWLPARRATRVNPTSALRSS